MRKEREKNNDGRHMLDKNAMGQSRNQAGKTGTTGGGGFKTPSLQ